MLYCSYFLTAWQFFLILTAYVQYNFYMRISQVTSSHFAKYFCDTYSEYITPCAVMTYGSCLRSYVPYARGLRSGPVEWIIRRMARKRKLANSFILFRAINKFSCLILTIIHAYNAGISWLQSEDTTLIIRLTPVRGRDSSRMLDSGRKIWLQLYILTLDALPDSGWRHDSDRISWLQSRITALVDERDACLTTSAVKDFAWLS
jgi:hypothetical protein